MSALNDDDRVLLHEKGAAFARQSIDLPNLIFREVLAEAAELVVQTLRQYDYNSFWVEAAACTFLEAAIRERRHLNLAVMKAFGSA